MKKMENYTKSELMTALNNANVSNELAQQRLNNLHNLNQEKARKIETLQMALIDKEQIENRMMEKIERYENIIDFMILPHARVEN